MTDVQIGIALVVGGLLLLCLFIPTSGRKSRGGAPSIWIDFDDFGDND